MGNTLYKGSYNEKIIVVETHTDECERDCRAIGLSRVDAVDWSGFSKRTGWLARGITVWHEQPDHAAIQRRLQHQEEERRRQEQQRQEEERRRQERQRQEEERRRQERQRQEEARRRQERQRQEEERRRQEQQRQEEERRRRLEAKAHKEQNAREKATESLAVSRNEHERQQFSAKNDQVEKNRVDQTSRLEKQLKATSAPISCTIETEINSSREARYQTMNNVKKATVETRQEAARMAASIVDARTTLQESLQSSAQTLKSLAATCNDILLNDAYEQRENELDEQLQREYDALESTFETKVLVN